MTIAESLKKISVKKLTNEKWQDYFLTLKNQIQPSTLPRMKYISDSSSSEYVYHGKTQYQCYCCFINDILKNIRKGKIDYCFYPYQVAELLKYEPKKLCAEWIDKDGVFKIYLKK